MDILNDDCQFLIIKQLRLIDQLMLYEATKTEKTYRWRSNLRHVWEQKKSYDLDVIHYNVIDRRPELLCGLLAVISSTVQELELSIIHTPLDLQCLTSYKFPKVSSFKYRRRIVDEYDEVTPILQIMSECAQNVEELDITDTELNLEILEIAVGFSKLRKLTIGSVEDEFLDYVIKKRDIIKLTIHDSFFGFDLKIISKLINLRQLTMYYTYSMDDTTLESAISSLPSLERLDLIIYTDAIDFEPYLLTLVAIYPSIKQLNLCNMSLEKESYIRIRSQLDNALKARSAPLSLYFHDIDEDVDEDEVRSYFMDSDLEISFTCLEIDDLNIDALTYYFAAINNE